MRKMLLIASHEFRRTAMTRGFWIQLLMAPLIFGIAIMGPRIAMQQRAADVYVLIDQTGTIARPLTAILDRASLRQPASPLQAQSPPPAPSMDIRTTLVRVPVPTDIDVTQAPTAVGAALKPYLNGSIKVMTPTGPRPLSAAILIPRGYGTSPDVAAQIWSVNAVNADLTEQLRAALSRIMRVDAMIARGIDPQAVAGIVAMTAPVAVFNPAKQNNQRVGDYDRLGQFVPSIFGYLLFISVFTVGARLLTGIVEERSNKLVETLLSSVTADQLMLGKLLGIGAVGIVVILVWIASAMVAINNFNAGGTGIAAIIAGAIDTKLMLAFVAYFIAAYIMNAALYLAVGSMSESMQDAQSYIVPLVFVSVLPLLMLVPISMAPNGTLAVVMSWIPLYTPIMMLARMAAHPPLWQIVGTTVVMLSFASLMLWLVARLFRVSILASGAAMRPAQILRVLMGRT